VIFYIETTIKKTFGKIPEDPEWFSCDYAEARRIGSFSETLVTYEKFTCSYESDVDREVLQRRKRLINLYCDKSVWFDVKVVPFEEYDFEAIKLREFERKFAI